MLQNNAITEVQPDTPGFYSNIFLVGKASGGWHSVIDLKQLNAHLNAPHFRIFSISSVLNTVRNGDFTFKIDLEDVNFHVPIHPDSRKYLCFTFESNVYQFRVLPFVLSTAPQVFTHLGHIVVGYLPRQGISLMPYLDDWLVPHPDNLTLPPIPATIFARDGGFKLNLAKSELEPVQDIQVLGLTSCLDLGRALVILPESRAREIVTHAYKLSSQSYMLFQQVSLFMESLI